MSGPSPATRLSLLDLRHFLKARLALPNGSSTILYVYLDETEQKLQGHNGDLEAPPISRTLLSPSPPTDSRSDKRLVSLSLQAQSSEPFTDSKSSSAFASDDADISKVRSSHSGWNYLSLMS